MNAFSLNGHAALVTGSSQGIGLAIALGLREAGARVVAHGRQERPGSLPEDTTYLACDLCAPAAPETLVERAIVAEPGLDTLVCNAGSFFDVPFLEMTEALWDKTMNLNLRTMFFTAQAFARHLVREKRGGSIVIMSSTNGFQAEPDSVAYDTSKGGLVMLTRSLAVSLAPHGIRLLSHSGSRGTGAAVCDHYSKLAFAQFADLPSELKRLAWLSLDSQEGREYWEAMELMGQYAAANAIMFQNSITDQIMRHSGNRS